MFGYLSAYVTPLACAALMFVLVGQVRPRSRDSLGEASRIRIVDLQGEDIPVFDVAETGKPVIFRDAAHARLWTARDTWGVDGIARRCGFADAAGLKLQGVYAQSVEYGPRFVMVRGADELQGGAGGGMDMNTDPVRDTVRKLSSALLGDVVTNPAQSGEYRYWFGPIEAACPRLTTTIPRHETLFLRHEQELVRAVTPSPTLWISGPNTTAQLHYDPSHNFHTLLYGSKIVRLYPPAIWPQIQLYPYPHPSKRQLRRGVKLPPDGGTTVTLRAGDTLYIPPFWFHQVRTGPEAGGATSVTVVSPSRDEILQSAYILAQAEALPALTSTRRDRIGAALAHLHKMLSAVVLQAEDSENPPRRDDIPSFLKRLVEARHSPGVSDTCNIACWNASTLCDHSHVLDDLNAGAERIWHVFDKLSGDGVRDIIVGDYTETVLTWALGGGYRHMSCYAAKCLEVDMAAYARACVYQNIDLIEDHI